jgi:CRP-like cAMP-binding protein
MQEKSNYLKVLPLFSDIPMKSIEQFCPSISFKSFEGGEHIYMQGDQVETLYCVVDGQAKLTRVNRDGSEVTIALLLSGDMFGAPLYNLTNFQNANAAIAKDKCTLMRVSIKEFKDLLKVNSTLGLRLIEQLDYHRQKMESRLECFAFRRTESRLIDTLKELSRGFDQRCEHGFGQHIRLSQQELADLVGATRPVVSTILNRLRNEGVLGYSREYICIRGFDAIQEIIDKY